MGGGVHLGGVLGVEHELDDPRAVAEVDEDQAAVVSPPVDPPGDAHRLARVGEREAPAPVIAEPVRHRRSHDNLLPRRIVGITLSGSSSF